MTNPFTSSSRVAIACGGTGGHLFPGLAVAHELMKRGCHVALLISPKAVDQQAVEQVSGADIVTLPAVALERGGQIGFVRGFVKSYRLARKHFKKQPPCAVLAMGGFTSAPPILAGRVCGAKAFLHESNTIPGRSNRWLSWVVKDAFVGFAQAGDRLHARNVVVTGTPVRSQFQPRDPAECRAKLGLDPARPTILVMGGSQGAGGINEAMVSALPRFVQCAPELQWIHLAGTKDAARIQEAHVAIKSPRHRAAVFPFSPEMDVLLGAATVVVSRAGASSLAELAAMRVPSLLIPFPRATDNHQFHNARAFEELGAARMLEQASATPEVLSQMILELIGNAAKREKMCAALAAWYAPKAAQQIANAIMTATAHHAPAGANAVPQTRPVEKVEAGEKLSLKVVT